MTDTTTHNESLGDRLRQLRAGRGLTQEDLAELVRGSISVDTISNIERGRVRPRRHTLLALLDALGVDAAARQEWLTLWRSPTRTADPAGAGDLRFPAPVVPMIGREEALDTLSALLLADGTRMVTLTGPGGVGKTRLAIATALALQDHFEGCTFADLAALRNPDELLSLVAFSLGMGDFGDRPIEERIVAMLRDKEILLVLDNAETAVTSSALLSPILEACPSLKLLVTSREPLRLRAEHEYAVPPLGLPPVLDDYDVSELAHTPSVQFLLQRVAMAVPGFTLTRENAPAVVRICRRLDGLPLALELAAARFKHYPPELLAARLDHALSLLVEGPRDLPERHRTLRATIDWSFSQLNEVEQQTLRRISVFIDGFSEAAASMVCGEQTGQTRSVEAVLDGLLEKSLVVLEPGHMSDQRRFRLLETIREYASERLLESGEDAAVRARHAGFFAGLAEAGFPELYSERRESWMETLRRDYGNLQAALAWSLDSGGGETETGLRLAGSLGRFWYYSGNLNDGRQWLARAIQAGIKGEPSHSLARVFYSAGKLAWVQGDFVEAVPLADQSVETAAIASPELFLAECLTLLAYTLVSAGNHEAAIPAFERSLEIERRLGARWQLAFTQAMYSEALRLQGKTLEAGSVLSEALTAFRSVSDPWGTGVALAMTAGVHFDLGDADGMESLLDQAEASFRQMDTETYALARMSIIRGYVNVRLGRLDAAVERFRDALKFSLELGQTAYILTTVAGVASLATVRGGNAREAAVLYAHASTLLDSSAIHVDDGAVFARAAYSQCFPMLQAQLSQETLEAAAKEGRSLSLDLAVQLAHSLLARPSQN